MKLFFFTESFPYGLGEAWKYNEIKALASIFDEVLIIPMWNGNNPTPLRFDNSNVTVLKPALVDYNPSLRFSDLSVLTDVKVFRELIGSGAWRNKEKLIKILLFYKRAKNLLKTPQYRSVLGQSTGKSIWYFYWGRGWADILPFVKKERTIKTVARFHGYDLYKERNKGYIPFRRQLLDKLDLVLLISENGRRYISDEYKIKPNKVKVCRIGTTFKGLSKNSTDNIIRIVSCSGVVPVKRLDRIVNALKKINNLNIHWTHIGSGPLFDFLQKEVKELPNNITVNLIGKLSPEEVSKHYLTNSVDLFINVSESEGVPVSVMEAFSFGIPVIATNVGGTSEIVDSGVGFLLSNDNVENSLIEALQRFSQFSEDQIKSWRVNALNRFQEKCDANDLSEKLAEILISDYK